MRHLKAILDERDVTTKNKPPPVETIPETATDTLAPTSANAAEAAVVAGAVEKSSNAPESGTAS